MSFLFLANNGTFQPVSGAYVNINNFGGDPTGTNDNSSAWTSAVAALGTFGGVIYFPTGKYKFTSAISLTYPSGSVYHVTVLGDGPDASILYFPSTNGLTVNYKNTNPANNPQGFDTRDISFTTGTTPGGGLIGLLLNQVGTNTGSYAAPSNFFRTVFRGDDGYTQTDGWGVCQKCNDISNINIDSCIYNGPGTAAGTGLQFGNYNTSAATANWTNASTTISIGSGLTFIVAGELVYNFTTGDFLGTVQSYSGTTLTLTSHANVGGSTGNLIGFGVATGLNVAKTVFQQLAIGCQYDNGFQGASFTGGSQWNGCTIGINGASDVVMDSLLYVIGCQFGIFAASASGITMSGAMNVLIIKGNLFLLESTGSNGINLAVISNTTITDNQFESVSQTGTTGINLVTSTANTVCIVKNNIISSFNIGLALQAGTSVIRAYTNHIINCTTAIANSGVSNQYGFQTNNFNPSNPTGTSSASVKMMGLGSTCTLTPQRGGSIRVGFTFTIEATGNTSVFVYGRYGTGTAPINGAADTGTAFGPINILTATAGGFFAPGCITANIPGTATGTTYWFDLAAQATSGTSTCNLFDINCDVADLE